MGATIGIITIVISVIGLIVGGVLIGIGSNDKDEITGEITGEITDSGSSLRTTGIIIMAIAGVLLIIGIIVTVIGYNRKPKTIVVKKTYEQLPRENVPRENLPLLVDCDGYWDTNTETCLSEEEGLKLAQERKVVTVAPLGTVLATEVYDPGKASEYNEVVDNEPIFDSGTCNIKLTESDCLDNLDCVWDRNTSVCQDFATVKNVL